MERGYLKVWRKIEDSQSYNRSALHRAILLTIFVKANWKGGFFCGRTVAPGQIATSIKSLAEELREPRTNVMRALRDIEKDGVINLENVGNKWTMITLVNWSTYQAPDEKSGQPAVNQRSTSGQPVDTIKEGKKERKKEERQKTPPTPASGGDLPGEPPSPVLGNSARELRAKVEAYTDSTELRAALEDFRVMRERIRKPLTQAALDLTIRDLDKFAGEDTARKVAIVQQSVQRGWQGIFQLKGDFQAQTNGPDDMEAAMERVRRRNERLKAAERGEVA